MLKPEWVSWDSVQECQKKAHEATNNNKGVHMFVQDMSGEALRQYMEKDGQCFVALDGDKVVGMCGVKIIKGNKWWSRGKKVAYNTIDAILPEYQGTDVYFGLQELRMKYTLETGAEMIQSNTAERNTTIRKIGKIKKFKEVQFSATSRVLNVDYYSVIMVKWLNGCPYSDIFIKFMFVLSKVVVKTIWKPGYKLRFWPIKKMV